MPVGEVPCAGLDTVYCELQMPLAKGKELLRLVNELRDFGAHPDLETVFKDMQFELTSTIDIVENLPTRGDFGPTRH
jgi:hypothetical protein